MEVILRDGVRGIEAGQSAWLGGNCDEVIILPSTLQQTLLYVRVHVNITLCKL